MNQIRITWEEFRRDVKELGIRIFEDGRRFSGVYGIPTGGCFVALELSRLFQNLPLLDETKDDCLIVDDLVDSGKTMERFTEEWAVLATVYSKSHTPRMDRPFFGPVRTLDGWIVFPWEVNHPKGGGDGPQDAIVRLLEFIGEDPNREGLKQTPERVIRSYQELFSGYKQNPEEIVKTFVDGACDEMVVLKNVQFTSFCEHHLLPMFGHAHIAYIPSGRILGISKMARLLEVYSRRLQVQERLTVEVTKCLDQHLQPLGSACVIEAVHSCMTCRGVNKQDSSLITSSLTGVFRDKPEVRAEFLRLIGK